MRQWPALFAFSRGIVSALALARTDQKRIALSAETMNNFISRVLGPMSFRPGWAYIGATQNNAVTRLLKFIFSTSDTAIVELTNLVARIWINDVVLTRVSVSTAVTNGTFSGNITGWTDGSESGGTASYEATNHLKLVSNGTARAIAYQQVTVSGGDISKEHALRIVINRGPVTLRIGSALDGEQYQSETVLDAGYHSIAFTPTGNFYVQFSSTYIYKTLVAQCTVEAAGIVTITTPWLSTALDYIRYDQSGDILYVACDGYQQMKIERRGVHPGGRSWSVCNYQTDDGPYRIQNIGPITLSASATTGDITVTASSALFRTNHVGALFAITTNGQTQTATVTAQNTFTAAIRVTGVGYARSFGIKVSGTITTSIATLQSSTDQVTWTPGINERYTTATTTSYLDGLDNQIVYYRLGVQTGEFTGGDSVVCTLIYQGGTQTGNVRITAYTNATSVSAQVLSAIGAASTATANWSEGMWSDFRGFPTSVRLCEGRLWWFGRNGIWASVSDAYTSFDAETLGDSGPINRTIGSGPVDVINFGLALDRLILGAEGKEISVRSSALDTPLTPTDFNMKDASTQGSAKVDAWKVDKRGVFIQRNGIKVYELAFDAQSYDYASTDLTAIVPELGSPGISRLDVQRQPDTRYHAVRSDGVVIIGTRDPVEDVLAWQTVSAANSGTVEDVVVLPSQSGSTEDQVYYVVKRTVNSSTVRYIEKWATEVQCRASTTSRNMDAHYTFASAPAGVISGGTHLIGQTVVVWADGAPVLETDGTISTFTVNGSGQITVTQRTVTTGCVGLAYTGQWKSSKLGVQVDATQSMLNQQKKFSHIGFILAYFYPKALQFGPDFTHLDDMPSIEQGTTFTGAQTYYDEQEVIFPGKWDTDLRLCLQTQSPHALTVMATVCDFEIHN